MDLPKPLIKEYQRIVAEREARAKDITEIQTTILNIESEMLTVDMQRARNLLTAMKRARKDLRANKWEQKGERGVRWRFTCDVCGEPIVVITDQEIFDLVTGPETEKSKNAIAKIGSGLCDFHARKKRDAELKAERDKRAAEKNAKIQAMLASGSGLKITSGYGSIKNGCFVVTDESGNRYRLAPE